MQLSAVRLACVSAGAFVVLLCWDLSGLDLAVAQIAGGAGGFPLRDDWFLNAIMHSGAKYAAWLLTLALCVMVAWPVGSFARLPLARRVQLSATVVLASVLVTVLKASSQTSCPWDMHEFGGVASQLSHWSGWLRPDGGGGRCFPAGHASSGFAFLGGYFAFRHEAPRIARRWLLTALVAGLVFGFSQQLRGAHFMSHTLWTGWLCWMTCWLTDPWFARDYPASAPRTARP